MSGPEVYAAMCAYVADNGWRREKPGSGWWWSDNGDEATIGEAVEKCFDAAGLDTRQEAGS